MFENLFGKSRTTPHSNLRSLKTRSLRMESLENRELLSASTTTPYLDGKTLHIDGTDGGCTCTVSVSNKVLTVVMNGKTVCTKAVSAVDKIYYYGGTGADAFTNDTSKACIAVGNNGNDTLIGGSSSDELHGGIGKDTLKGKGGVDYLYGEDGNDILIGNAGDDHLDGGNNDDTIYGGDKKLLDTNTGIDWVTGGYGNDTIYGGDGNDNLQGGDGNNTIYGEADNDTIVGGNNNDFLDGGYGDDTFTDYDGYNIMLGQAGADNLTGGLKRDLLIGGTGTDYIHGGEGDDILIGGVTSYDNNASALAYIFSKWTTDEAYSTRVSNTYAFLNPKYVFDDSVKDSLIGHNGTDLFYGRSTDYFSKDSSETLITI